MPASEDLLKRLGVDIDSETLRLALTHRSYAYEHGGIPTNERLEFLGDSVLGFTVTEYLYERYPDLPEGDLAKRRAAVVSTRALARVARDLELGQFVYLGQGEKLTNGADKSSILADTTEALIGATFLSLGIDTAKAMVLRLIAPLIEEVETLGAGTDWKTAIQEVAAARKLGQIQYVVEGSGPDHARVFVATLTIGGTSYGSGSGPSKKEAEQEAAASSWRLLNPDSADSARA
ncbi:ribonuclease III [Zhihengliuella halotolerans]|uniref:ribonuclease III n=1 Tax=Zhihengliuella halotolerans TaxID=370736 RepID=UPI000C80CB4E|nr:ribonuclease III [Zhihengliuella halotolerans]